jgi:hypothetical protein
MFREFRKDEGRIPLSIWLMLALQDSLAVLRLGFCSSALGLLGSGSIVSFVVH